MERLSVEVWQQIILKVMESNNWPIFTTSCTPYTFLSFIYLHIYIEEDRKPYHDYLTQRGCLRLVCRAWNECVLFTSHRWLLPEDEWSPMYKLDSTTTARAKGGVGPVEKLYTGIYQNKHVTPILSWVSHILKRPESQSPLRAYILRLDCTLGPGYNPLDDLLVRTTTAQDPECTTMATNTTLRLLVINELNHSFFISLPQISRTFTGLRSLFLSSVTAAPQQTLTLPHLEVLYVEYWRAPRKEIKRLIRTWHTPALRHVYLTYLNTRLKDVINCFLGRYAHQIESLILKESDSYWQPLLNLPSGFWAQFPALRLLGLGDETLGNPRWSGWSVVPPSTHPCRYLVDLGSVQADYELSEAAYIRQIWTWNDGVRLVVGHAPEGRYYVVKHILGDSWIANTEWNVGILPEL